jgi:hypothetical protein
MKGFGVGGVLIFEAGKTGLRRLSTCNAIKEGNTHHPLHARNPSNQTS